jgi:hypothetical protein
MVQDAIRSERQLPLPRVILEGGRRGWIGALIEGAVIGAVALILPALMSDKDAFAFFAVFLGTVAGVYLGFALSDGRFSIFNAEYVGLVVYGAAAVLSLTLNESLILAAGYVGHGLWDAIHPHAVDTRMPWWYVPICIGFDFVFGIYILVRFL